jgi:3-carboxy-cis,cis-muconate cycloisomerase
MMALAPYFGRSAAHHVIERVCDVALAEGIDLATALQRDPEVRAQLDEASIARLTDPTRYLGASRVFVARVLDQATRLLSEEHQ